MDVQRQATYSASLSAAVSSASIHYQAKQEAGI